MNDGLRNAAKELMDHDGLIVLWHGIECLLDDMTAKGVHGEVQSVSSNGLCNLDHLFRCAVLKASLNEEVSKSVDHQGICLCDNGLDDFVFLLGGADFQFLLQEDRSLLIVVADNFVDNVFPIAIDISVQQTAIVERFRWRKVCRSTLWGHCLQSVSVVSPVVIRVKANLALPPCLGGEFRSMGRQRSPYGFLLIRRTHAWSHWTDPMREIHGARGHRACHVIELARWRSKVSICVAERMMGGEAVVKSIASPPGSRSRKHV